MPEAELPSNSPQTPFGPRPGVIGIAWIQAIIVVCLTIAGIPFAGLLAVVVLVLGIAQVPALIFRCRLSAGFGRAATTTPSRPLSTPFCCS